MKMHKNESAVRSKCLGTVREQWGFQEEEGKGKLESVQHDS